jgi:uncharacterized membrane protein YqjE
MFDLDRHDDHAAPTADGAARAARTGAAPGAQGGVARFTSDVVALAELQVRLAAVNTGEALANARAPIAVIGFAGLMFTAAVTVALLGAATLLSSALAIAQGWAMVGVAFAAGALAAPAALLACARLQRCIASFRGSREELERNLSWLHAVLDTAATEPHS